MKNLLIVESPNKAKTIRQWLGKDWHVIASGGHIKNLPTNTYSIEKTKDKFTATWEVMDNKKKLLSDIKSKIKDVQHIYIGTDDDREGERIGFDIVEHFKIKDYYRVIFHEITKETIFDSLKNGLYIDKNRTNAQFARRVIDRIIGYPISSAIRDKFKKDKIADEESIKNLGIGRVTAPALNIIVQNERRIQKFIPKKYKKIYITYMHEGLQFNVSNGMKFYEEQYEELSLLHAMVNDGDIEHVIEKYKEDTRDVAPYAPLITSRIYRNMNYLYHLDPSQTKKILQKLFEGIEIVNKETGTKEIIGLITYPRTDSFNISEKAIDAIRNCLYEKYGKEYVTQTTRVFKNKSKTAQEAHEAIRPTSFSKEFFPKNLRNTLTKEQFSDEEFLVYEFIFYRTLSTQMKNSIYDNSKLIINIGGNKFQCIGNKQLFDGWEKLLGDKIKKAEDEDEHDIVEVPKSLKVGDILGTRIISLSEPKNDKTPPRIGLGRFITILDEKNIARPSTIGDVTDLLIKRKLISVLNNMLIPTELGISLVTFLEEHGEWLIDIDHTEEFEKQLDEIEEGEEPNKLIYEYDKLKDEFLDKLGFNYNDSNQPQQWLIDKANNIALKKNEILDETIKIDTKKLKNYILEDEKTTKIGKCPECKKNDIHEREKTYSCKNIACDFTIWKNSISKFFENFEKYMPVTAHKDLLTHILKNKKIWFDDLYSKKNTKTFSAFVILEKSTNGKSHQLALSFLRTNMKSIDEKYIFNADNYEDIKLIDVPEENTIINEEEYHESNIDVIEDNTATSENKYNKSNIELLKKVGDLEKERRLLILENQKDKLTRVYNRGKFEDDLNKIWDDRYTNLTIGFIDFDKFKMINDKYGHQAGDEVLIKISNLIHETVRNFDIELYRYGGEEFCLVSKENRSLSNEIFESLRKDVRKYPFIFNNIKVNVSISIGVTFRNEEDSTQSFIQRADAMVYQAKEKGRDRIEIAIHEDVEEIIW
ncbi:MAG: DNA topoisomerase 1 [Arcobacter sp.]|nr:DNA topoisomerase 1 [Arcobacter sp.]